ncbi:MAG: tRNA epoxyqueuosine(34) reductase QueG [bacterium]
MLSSHMRDLKEKIKNIAIEVGFDLVGVARVEEYPEMAAFLNWVESGYGADMSYLTDKTSPRINPDEVLPGAKSVISCGLLYNTNPDRSIDMNSTNHAWVSRYAWGKDYHYIVGEKLGDLVGRMSIELPQPFSHRCYVDTGPVLERTFAYHAGLGWFGKNSCLINPKHGSYFFIGEILTDLALEPDRETSDFCGSCTRCIDACPTNAIVADGVVDSRKCISYHTIENRGTIPESIRADMGHHIFGCDICQEVCPWNVKSPLSQESEFMPRAYMFHPTFGSLADRIMKHYPDAFPKSPLKRPKQAGLLRNLFIVIGNKGNSDFLPLLDEISVDGDEILRETREWAIKQIRERA